MSDEETIRSGLEWQPEVVRAPKLEALDRLVAERDALLARVKDAEESRAEWERLWKQASMAVLALQDREARVRALLERIADVRIVSTDVGELNTYTLTEVKRMAEAALDQGIADG